VVVVTIVHQAESLAGAHTSLTGTRAAWLGHVSDRMSAVRVGGRPRVRSIVTLPHRIRPIKEPPGNLVTQPGVRPN
jgi:hypothetical protein